MAAVRIAAVLGSLPTGLIEASYKSSFPTGLVEASYKKSLPPASWRPATKIAPHRPHRGQLQKSGGCHLPFDGEQCEVVGLTHIAQQIVCHGIDERLCGEVAVQCRRSG